MIKTYLDRYSKYFLKILRCKKNGERPHISASFSVLTEAKRTIGSTKEKVHHDQRVTLSSGQESVADGA